MLTEHIEFMVAKQKDGSLPQRIEIILVDDGSKDKTWDYILEMTKKYPESETSPTVFVRGLKQLQNQGKGAAVKSGSIYSRGEFILMVDADGATDFNEITKIYKIVWDQAKLSQKNLACAIGSRNIE